MAVTRFWVGGTGTWDTSTTTHWSASSGGAGGASVPATNDTATFDASSGTGTVTVSGAVSLTALSMGSSSVLTLSGTGTRTVKNNVTLGTNVTYSATGLLTLSAAGTFTSNSKSWGGSVTVSPNTVTLADAFSLSSTSTLTFTGNGKFAAAANTVSVGKLVLGANPPTITGSVTWTITGTGTVVDGTTSPLTQLPTGLTLKITDTTNAAVTFSAGVRTYDTVWFSRGASTGTNTVSGSGTYGTFKDTGTAAHQIIFPINALGDLQTMTAFVVSGSLGNLISLRSSSAGSQFTLSQASGTVSSDYLDVQDSDATGGALWNAGNNSTDSGNNTGWKFGVSVLLTVSAGAYALTGTAASVLHRIKIAAGSGSYAMTGSAVTITESSRKVLAAASGSYQLTGTAATVKVKRKIAALAGSYLLSGTAAQFMKAGWAIQTSSAESWASQTSTTETWTPQTSTTENWT